MKTAIAILALAGALSGCGGDDPPDTPAVVSAPKPPAPSPNALQMDQWKASCALCHVDGTGGAPRVGIAEEWAPRIGAGDDVLLAHTLDGFNNMPPLGYCMSCTEDDFRALIRFMSQSRGPQ